MPPVVALFPGQGSQKPGMGKDLAEGLAAAHSVFARADAALGEPLSELCFAGPAETLTLTHNAQPALLTHGAAVWAAVASVVGPHLVAAAGHSLGEFTAWHAVGALTLEDAVRLVRRRGELMYATGLARPGAMAAILGDPSESIDAICARASADPTGGLVVAANYNCPGQVVISGEVAGVRKAMEMLKAAGAKRTVELPVSGAFHSPLMEPASAGLADALAKVPFGVPSVPVCVNVTAELVRDPDRGRALLVEQLTAPVRWTQVISELAARFPDALFVEMGPGAVLTGLVRKIAPAVATTTCGTAAEVHALIERLS
jgi:[acyl-carrier-protein] S-malonyltransferase